MNNWANPRQPLQRKPWGEDRQVTNQTEKAFQAQVMELAQYLGWARELQGKQEEAMTQWGTRQPLARKPWGEERKGRYQAELEQSRAFEDLLALHRVDWWHVNLPMRSKAGFPDYMIMGFGWLAFVELKATSPTTGKTGRLSAEQIAFHERLHRAGATVVVFVLPRDLEEANAWLKARTHIDVVFT